MPEGTPCRCDLCVPWALVLLLCPTESIGIDKLGARQISALRCAEGWDTGVSKIDMGFPVLTEPGDMSGEGCESHMHKKHIYTCWQGFMKSQRGRFLG